MLKTALAITYGYLAETYCSQERKGIWEEIGRMVDPFPEPLLQHPMGCSYEEVQAALSNLNEKESIRKKKGVYYTPVDVVRFILVNSAKFLFGKLKPGNIAQQDLNSIPYRVFCFQKTIYDPTCGAGAFLLAALEMKLELLESHHVNVSKGQLQKVVATLQGNDLNSDSIAITKIRLLLCAAHRYGAGKVKGLSDVLNGCFTSFDYVTDASVHKTKYDIIVGNPPYVEDARSDSLPQKKYGNIYANVLENAALHLNPGGTLGFIVPLSYVSTPRMQKIRDVLYLHIPEQYVLSFSDRPDCLFTAVHQKLCVLFGRNTGGKNVLYTGNYRYWYREERPELFRTTNVVRNDFVTNSFVPKLGSAMDSSIYQKVIQNREHLQELLKDGQASVFLNMRAAFWIKAFLTEHPGAEYKEMKCANEEYANFCMCLLNSSLFWWYWICVSDCWHITQKELAGFGVPDRKDLETAGELAHSLEEQLELTKHYIGSKQTEYEYKHRACIQEIHRIDDYIHALYGLTEEESLYIKNFAYRYRMSGGTENGCH